MRTATPWALPNRPVARSQLLDAGVTPAMLRTALASGSLVALRRGVYVAGSAWPHDPAARHLLLAHAELTVNPEAVLSHQSAAVAWRLPNPTGTRWTEMPVAVTLPASGHSSRTRAAVHHVAPLPPDQVTRDEQGYPATTPARTAVDLAAGLDLPEALMLLDCAARRVCQGFMVSPRRRDLANPRLAQAARVRLETAAAIRRITRLDRAITLANPLRESPAESFSAAHFFLAGLPTPILQAEIRTPIGVFYPDFYWPEFGVIGECDGAEKYDGPTSILNEKQREQALRDAVPGMVRWLAAEIMFRPWVVVERVARALGVSYRV